jgi:hypothetical protein
MLGLVTTTIGPDVLPVEIVAEMDVLLQEFTVISSELSVT